MNKYFLTSNLNFSWLCVKSCKRAEGMLTDEKANHRFKSHYALLSMQTMEIYFCTSQWSVKSVCHKDYNNWTSLYKLAEVFFSFSNVLLLQDQKGLPAIYSILQYAQHPKARLEIKNSIFQTSFCNTRLFCISKILF